MPIRKRFACAFSPAPGARIDGKVFRGEENESTDDAVSCASRRINTSAEYVDPVLSPSGACSAVVAASVEICPLKTAAEKTSDYDDHEPPTRTASTTINRIGGKEFCGSKVVFSARERIRAPWLQNSPHELPLADPSSGVRDR